MFFKKKLLVCFLIAFFLCANTAILTSSTISNKQSSQLIGFMMPSKNIFCAVFEDHPLRCEIRSRLNPLPPQSRPHNHCYWGGGLLLPQSGPVEILCAGDTIWNNYQILSYGKTWRRDGFECVSQTTGLTCKNRTGNGFFLSRERWKVF